VRWGSWVSPWGGLLVPPQSRPDAASCAGQPCPRETSPGLKEVRAETLRGIQPVEPVLGGVNGASELLGDPKGMGAARGLVPAPRDQVPWIPVPQLRSHPTTKAAEGVKHSHCCSRC